ncbi:hypothetical protein PFISCL1PPCAC_7324, partial [Pristionchus fissidentatus]
RMSYREICGIRAVRTEFGTYLGVSGEWGVCQAPLKYQWTIEDHNGKVALKTMHSDGRWLRQYDDVHVELQVHCLACELWTPVPNADGSWSFCAANGRWLSGTGDGQVLIQPHKLSSERFWIDRC